MEYFNVFTGPSIQTAEIDNGAITTAKLAANAVTTAKITDANITTAKIADGNVTKAKIAAAAITTSEISATAGILLSQLGQSGATDGQVVTWDNTNSIWKAVTPAGAYALLTTNALGANAASLTATFNTTKKNLLILCDIYGFAGADNGVYQFNGDTGNNYDYGFAAYPAALNAGSNNPFFYDGTGTNTARYQVQMIIRNISNQYKQVMGRTILGGSTLEIWTAQWKNTAAQITSILAKGQVGQNLLSGSRITVLGFDEA